MSKLVVLKVNDQKYLPFSCYFQLNKLTAENRRVAGEIQDLMATVEKQKVSYWWICIFLTKSSR